MIVAAFDCVFEAPILFSVEISEDSILVCQTPIVSVSYISEEVIDALDDQVICMMKIHECLCNSVNTAKHVEFLSEEWRGDKVSNNEDSFGNLPMTS